MKKIIFAVIALLLTICLSSCITVTKNIELTQNRDNVQAIEIYYTEEMYYEGDISSFRKHNEPFVTLKEDFSDFLDVITALEYEEEKILFPIPMDGGYDYSGYVIAVVYSDGGYDIIAARGLYSYGIGKNGNGRHKYDHSDYCGETPWIEFIAGYIEK